MRYSEIKGLHRITEDERDKMYDALIDAMHDYPKQNLIFPDMEDKLNSIKAAIYFYGEYDLAHGAAFSIDEEINEVAIIVPSEEMDLTEERLREAGSYGTKYYEAFNALSPDKQKLRSGFFDKLDEFEAEIEFPTPHIYMDFVGVRTAFQGQGRGHRLVEPVCRYADEAGLPIMLFTNSDEDIRFYESMGFIVYEIKESVEFGFVNTYMMYFPK